MRGLGGRPTAMRPSEAGFYLPPPGKGRFSLGAPPSLPVTQVVQTSLSGHLFVPFESEEDSLYGRGSSGRTEAKLGGT